MRNVKKWKMMMLACSAAAVMMLGGCGKTENKEVKTENQEAKTENQEAKTENQEAKTENQEAKTENKEVKTETEAAKTETEAAETEAVNNEEATGTPEASAADGMFASMDTVDLSGKQVDSGIFADKKLTMVNIWNTGCTPCIQELPELERLSQEYADKGVAVKGLLYDLTVGVSDATKKEAEEILSKAGATYQQLTVSEAMFQAEELQNLVAFPTTYFVDSNGQVVEQIEGSRDYEGWKEILDEKLEAMPSDAEA